MNILSTVKVKEIKVIVGYEGRSSETRRSGGRSRSTRRGERLGWLGEGRRHETDRVYEGRSRSTRRGRGEGLAIPLYETDR